MPCLIMAFLSIHNYVDVWLYYVPVAFRFDSHCAADHCVRSEPREVPMDAVFSCPWLQRW